MSKQIEEMAAALKFCRNTTIEECRTKVDCKHCIAEQIYNAGYRRQDEVAKEIFAEIEKEIIAALESNYRARKQRLEGRGAVDSFVEHCDGKIAALRGIADFIDDYLKKKYGVTDDEQMPLL